MSIFRAFYDNWLLGESSSSYDNWHLGKLYSTITDTVLSFAGTTYLTTSGQEKGESFCLKSNSTAITSGISLNLLRWYSRENVPFRAFLALLFRFRWHLFHMSTIQSKKQKKQECSVRNCNYCYAANIPFSREKKNDFEEHNIVQVINVYKILYQATF